MIIYKVCLSSTLEDPDAIRSQVDGGCAPHQVAINTLKSPLKLAKFRFGVKL